MRVARQPSLLIDSYLCITVIILIREPIEIIVATIPDNSITLFYKFFYSADLSLTLNQ